MKAIVTVPSASFNDLRGGVFFYNGKGEFTDIEKAKQIAEEFGYAIEIIGEEKPVKKAVKKAVKDAKSE
jgi:hypothetical protein